MTEYIVICTKHRHYLKFVGMTGLVWTTDRSEAKTWPTIATAEKAADKARLMLHTPVAQEGVMSEPRYDVEVELVGHDGNVFNIIGRVAHELRRKVSQEAATEFVETATSQKSYEAVLRLVIQTVHVTAKHADEEEEGDDDRLKDLKDLA